MSAKADRGFWVNGLIGYFRYIVPAKFIGLVLAFEIGVHSGGALIVLMGIAGAAVGVANFVIDDLIDKYKCNALVKKIIN